MLNRKIAALLCALSIFATVYVGCSKKEDVLVESVPESSTSDSESSLIDEPEIVIDQSDHTFTTSDENIEMTISFTQPNFTLDEAIASTLTVKNTSEYPIFFTKGSGSNIVPEAMEISLGELAGMFYPQAMTMDMVIGEIQPGETLTFDLKFAPYISKNKDNFAFGTDKDIDFFKSDDFTPALSGAVNGKVKLTYLSGIDGNDQNKLLMGEAADQIKTISLDFETAIA